VQAIIKLGADISKSKVLVMGTTFKENVSDIRNSKVADLIHELKGYSLKVDVIDPHADSDELQHEYGYTLTEKIDTHYQAIIVAVNHDKYANLEVAYFKELASENALIVDLKGIYRNKLQNVSGLKYWSL
jgi:UDP-N-acetyl-D-galactosamine dehydrogenase